MSKAAAVMQKKTREASTDDRLWKVDDNTRQTAPAVLSESVKKQIAEVQASNLSKELKEATIATLAAPNEFSLALARGQAIGGKPAPLDLIEVRNGIGKPKLVSPHLLRSVLEHADFVRRVMAQHGM